MGSPASRCASCQALIPLDAARCDACGLALVAPVRPHHRMVVAVLFATATLVVLRFDPRAAAESAVPGVRCLQATGPRTPLSYYEEGIQFKQRGWVERSRRSLSMAVELDKGEVGKKAASFMRAYLPAHPITREAEQLNIQGYNYDHGGHLVEAKRVFSECIVKYPDFEWPYGNLGSILVSQGEVEKGIELLEKALTINPWYRNGLLHMAHAHLARSDRAKALQFYRRAFEADPSDSDVREEAKANGCAF